MASEHESVDSESNESGSDAFSTGDVRIELDNNSNHSAENEDESAQENNNSSSDAASSVVDDDDNENNNAEDEVEKNNLSLDEKEEEEEKSDARQLSEAGDAMDSSSKSNNDVDDDDDEHEKNDEEEEKNVEEKNVAGSEESRASDDSHHVVNASPSSSTPISSSPSSSSPPPPPPPPPSSSSILRRMTLPAQAQNNNNSQRSPPPPPPPPPPMIYSGRFGGPVARQPTLDELLNTPRVPATVAMHRALRFNANIVDLDGLPSRNFHPSPAVSRSPPPPPPPPPATCPPCYICLEPIDSTERGTYGLCHRPCLDCFSQIIRMAIKDSAIAKCGHCRKEIPLHRIEQHIARMEQEGQGAPVQEEGVSSMSGIASGGEGEESPRLPSVTLGGSVDIITPAAAADAASPAPPARRQLTLRDQYIRVRILRTNESARECPDCHTLCYGNADEPDMECTSCKLQFCFWHSNSHKGRKCKGLDDETKQGVGTWLWTHTRTRKCHRCGARVQRNGGCPHMTCRCGAEFCWYCGDDWTSVGYKHRNILNFRPSACWSPRYVAARCGVILGAIPVLGIGLGVAPIVGIIYGSYSLHKYRKRRRDRQFETQRVPAHVEVMENV